MAALRDAPSVESGHNPPVASDETTSLLHGQEVSHYSSGISSSASTKRNAYNTEREGDELHSVSKTENRIVVSEWDMFARSPMNWVWHKTTRGRAGEVSLTLQNSGSVARDHLALERTFLAYMRTSLALASAGVALVQLFNTSNKSDTERIEKYARPLGAGVIGLGVVVLSIGLARFFVVQSALVRGVFPVARIAAVFISVVLMALVTVVFWILVTGGLEF